MLPSLGSYYNQSIFQLKMLTCFWQLILLVVDREWVFHPFKFDRLYSLLTLWWRTLQLLMTSGCSILTLLLILTLHVFIRKEDLQSLYHHSCQARPKIKLIMASSEVANLLIWNISYWFVLNFLYNLLCFSTRGC